MSPTLLALPDELLIDIISHLNDPHGKSIRHTWQEPRKSPHPLWGLALVNHRLSAIAGRMLYEDVVVHFMDYRYLPDRALRFAQICKDNPAVAHRLRKIYIFWDYRIPLRWGGKFWDSIGLAKDLQVLKLESRYGSLEEGIMPSVIEHLVLRLQNLEVLIMNNKYLSLSPRAFWRICRQPNLRVLEMTSQIRETQPPFDTLTSAGYSPGGVYSHVIPQTSLTSLRCSNEHTDPGVLHLVLANSPNLVKLQLSWPALALNYGPVGFLSTGLATASGSVPYMKPAVRTRKLLPCAETLQELILLNSTLQGPKIWDHALDFSWLRQLVKATISIRVLQDPRTRQTSSTALNGDLPSNDWFRSLPNELQILEIQFDDSFQGLLWNVKELKDLDGHDQMVHIRTRCLEGLEEQYDKIRADFGHRIFEPRISLEIRTPARLSWLTDVIERRSGCLEHLRTFKIVEINSLDYRSPRWDRLDLTETYPEVFGRPGLDFTLLVRTPPDYIPPSIECLSYHKSSGRH